MEKETRDKAGYRPKPGLWIRAPRKIWARLRTKLLCLRHRGLSIGPKTVIRFSHVEFDTWCGPITIGKLCGIEGGKIWGHAIIGDGVNLISPCRIGGSSKYKVIIGSGTWVAPNAYIVPVTHCYKKRDKTISEQGIAGGDITIGEDCWIGINAVISPGVTIGKGAVIGANSVVTKDISEYAVAVGAPAKVISYRE